MHYIFALHLNFYSMLREPVEKCRISKGAGSWGPPPPYRVS